MEMTIEELVKESYRVAKAKGWHSEPKSFGDDIALMHSELSEALEDFRNHKAPDQIYYEGKKPCGIPVEFADVIIRIFDVCGKYGINLEEAVKIKMEYNADRDYRHGGKAL